LPDIEHAIHQTYGDEVIVIGLHKGEDPGLLADFVEQTGVTFPLVVDEGGTLGQFAFPQGVGYPYPRDIVIDKELTIRSVRNSFDMDEMTVLVDALVGE
jgi:hypothetical protein